MKKNVFAGLVGLGAAALLSLPACQGSGSYAKVNEQLESINAGQKEILARLDKIEASGGAAKPGQQPDRPQAGRPDPAATYKVPIGDAVTKGPETAKVTIVEWSDFQCPFCSRVGPTLEELQKEYGDNIRIAFKHNPLPFHQQAMPAALAAEAAGRQGKFWEMHDKLFANAKELTQENFEKWAKELGLDVEKFKKDMEDPALKTKITKQQQEGAQIGARGTPSFFINGRPLSGAQPTQAFKAVIDEELKEAEKLIAAGTPPNKVYEKVIENGKTKV